MNTEEKKSRIAALRYEMDDLATKKREIEVKRAEMKNTIRCSGRMPHHQYQQLCNDQTKCNKEILAIEGKLKVAKQEFRQLNDDVFFDAQARKEERSKNAVGTNGETVVLSVNWKREVVESLSLLRSEYQEFAADPTRISSKRQMASEFVLKLNPIIRQFLKD